MPEITLVGSDNSVLQAEQNVTIRGLDFGFATGRVLISPTDSAADTAATIFTTFDSWSDDLVQLDLTAGEPGTKNYWFVEDVAGVTNAAGFFVATGTPWQALIDDTARIVDDTSFTAHSRDSMLRWLRDAELFLIIHRRLGHTQGNLSLTAGTAVYAIHGTFADFVLPLRITISNTPLLRTSLATLVRSRYAWQQSTDTPTAYAMIGATHLAFWPPPNAASTAVVTYLRFPTTSQAVPAHQPVIDQIFRRLLPHYAAALCFAAEGDVQKAQEQMTLFARGAGVRDPRFGRGAGIKPPASAEEPLTVAGD